jgi:hypothetical protein
VALFATGATVGVLTGGPLVRRGLRQLAIGAGAAVVTYGLGRLFGTTLRLTWPRNSGGQRASVSFTCLRSRLSTAGPWMTLPW